MVAAILVLRALGRFSSRPRGLFGASLRLTPTGLAVLVQIRSGRICRTFWGVSGFVRLFVVGGCDFGVACFAKVLIAARIRHNQKKPACGGFFWLWRAREDYSARPCASPLRGFAALVQIRSGRICRTLGDASRFVSSFVVGGCGTGVACRAKVLIAARARHNQKNPLVAGSLDYGAPERIRTSDLCLRRAALYPAELRARGLCGA